MNLLSGLLSGEKRPPSDSPTPEDPDDPLETTVLAALQKFLPSLVAQMSEKVVDTLKATIEVTVAAAVEPLKTEIGQLAGRVGTIEEQFTSLGSNLHSILDAKVESKVATRVGIVNETVRATYEAIDNNVNYCLCLHRNFGEELTLSKCNPFRGCGDISPLLHALALQSTAVLIKFTSVAAKHAAYKKAKELRRQFNVAMNDDLTPQQKAARTSCLPEVQTLRGEGWITFWRGDQLFKVKAGGAPLKVPVRAPTAAPAAPPSSSPAADPTPSTSSRAAGPSPMCA
eukprot:jgi/Botrbrau1/6827/Bobra.0153s0022.1